MPGIDVEVNNNNFNGSYEQAQEAAEAIRGHIKSETPKLGIICGSGLGKLGDTLQSPVKIDFNLVPHFQKSGSGVEGHSGELVIGQLSGVEVLCLKGRFHPYEGYPPWKVAFPIRVMKILGIESVIVTNAAGGMNPDFSVGDFMLIKDHIYLPGLMGYSPLVGPNDPRFGTRFPPMSDAYDPEWLKLALKVAQESNERIKEGVYCCVFGPSYETPAEKRFLSMMGGDAVGMSTIHEVVAARHAGMRVLAISLITNMVVDSTNTEVADHAEVLEAGKARTHDMINFVTKIISQMKSSNLI